MRVERYALDLATGTYLQVRRRRGAILGGWLTRLFSRFAFFSFFLLVRWADDDNGRKAPFPSRSLEDRIDERRSVCGRISRSVVDDQRDQISFAHCQGGWNRCSVGVVGWFGGDSERSAVFFWVEDFRVLVVQFFEFLTGIQLHLPGEFLGI